MWLDGARRFGVRSIFHMLPPELGGATLYRVRKCMRELGIRGVRPNAGRCTSIPDEGAAALSLL